MLSLSEFLTPDGLARYDGERRLEEERQAMAFLRRSFAPATALLSDDELRDVARFGIAHAQQRGVTSLRDRQRYLIPVMFWGSYFELDPQYRDALARCWWIDRNGRRTGSTHLSAVIAEIDRIERATVPDHADMRRPVQAMARLYRDHEGELATSSLMLSHMESCWPARFALMGGVHGDYLDALAPVLRRYGLKSADAVAYACIAMQLGFRFADDPRFPWARAALAPDDRTPEERRLAFGQAVLRYWQSLLPQEGE